MNKFARITSVCVVALGVVAGLSSEVSADYEVSVWGNDTSLTVGGMYRWGNGPWQSFSLGPGGGYSTWNNLGNGGQPLFIRFDADPGPGVDMVQYRLRTYYSPTTVFQNGATEVFFIRGDGRVELANTRL